MGHGRASKASTSKVSKQAAKFDRAAGEARLKAIAQSGAIGVRGGRAIKLKDVLKGCCWVDGTYQEKEIMPKHQTQTKARKILRDGSVRGKLLTAKARRFFGARAGGASVKRK